MSGNVLYYIGNVPNIKYCKIRWWSLDELLLKLLFHFQHSLCGLVPFITSMQHWIKWYELAQKFILLSMTLPDCVWADKSGPAWRATVKQLCAGCSHPRVKEGTQTPPLAAWQCLTHSPQGSLPSSCHSTKFTHPQPLRQLLLLSSHSNGELKYSEEELKMKSSSMPEQSKAGLVQSKCTKPGDGSCSVLMNV